MKPFSLKQAQFSIGLKASKNKADLPYMVEVPDNRTARRLQAKLERQQKKANKQKDHP